MAGRERGSEVVFRVTGWQHYGVLVETDSGERGWIISDLVSDRPMRQEEWPPVGTVLRGLVLTYVNDGRVVVSLRQVDGRQSPDKWPREESKGRAE